MELQKYKVCPACGEHNTPSLLECRKCETDLTGIKVVDCAAQSAPSAEEAPPSAPLVRICECGAQNPPQARKCNACGEDISDILPCSAASDKDIPFTYELSDLDGNFSVRLEEPVTVIGRNAALKEYLGAKSYVSRTHAKLTIVAGKVFIENLSKTNGTYINNAPLECGTPVPLQHGDEIGFGGKVLQGTRQEQAAYFTLSIKP